HASITTLIKNEANYLVRRLFQVLAQIGHELGEIAKAAGCFTLDKRDFFHFGSGGERTDLARYRVIFEVLQRHLADAACRLVDNALKRNGVARIEQQPEVGEYIAVFLAIIESQPAHDLIGHALTDKRLFQPQ